MSDDAPLSERACIPCRGGVPPLDADSAQRLLKQLRGQWRINDSGHLAVEYVFDDFVGAMAFANGVAEIAEREQHHPDLTVRWGQVGIEVWTHKISGLTESDFILAAKIERLHSHSRP